MSASKLFVVPQPEGATTSVAVKGEAMIKKGLTGK